MRQSGDMKKFSAYYKNKFQEVIPTSSELIKTTQFKCFCGYLKIQATKNLFSSKKSQKLASANSLYLNN